MQLLQMCAYSKCSGYSHVMHMDAPTNIIASLDNMQSREEFVVDLIYVY